MPARAHRVVPNLYRDSVALMQLAAALLDRPAVRRATAAMATPANLEQAAAAGLLPPDLACAPDDLLLAVEADDAPGAEAALAWAAAELARVPDRAAVGHAGSRAEAAPRTLAEGQARLAGASVAFIAAPGPFAAAESLKALKRGLHVVLFSSGVSLEDEAALKSFAVARGLLMLGAECGTAILGGTPFGFANTVRRGAVGIAAASGTGLQELCCLIHRWGGGVSHAVGVGGRDLSEQVGGAMLLAALDLLLADPATAIVVLLSKPPAPAVAARVAAAARGASKPVILALLGAAPETLTGVGLPAARTLEDAALLAVAAAGLAAPALADPPVAPAPPPRRFVRGLFAGGTLCAEAALILGERLGPVVSPTDDDPLPAAHSCLDLGDERFTQGRPHPMIDAGLRAEQLAAAARDPRAAVVLLDVVLGHGAAADPVGPLLAAVDDLAPADRPALVAHVCGTDDDPQVRARQVARLQAAGVIVAATNAQAARLAAAIAGNSEG